MLSIILLCLKVIGILLLIILGVALFLILSVLFVPVRYRLAGCFEETKKAEALVSWGGIVFRARAAYEYEKDLRYTVRIFGVTILTSEEKITILQRILGWKERREEKRRRKIYEKYQRDLSEFSEEEWDNDAWANLPEGYEPKEWSSWEDHMDEYRTGYPWDTVDGESQEDFPEEKESVKERVQGLLENWKEKRQEKREQKEWEKAMEPEKTVEEPQEKWYNNLEEKMEDLSDKYERLERFYYENQSQYAVRKMFGLIKKTICYILPTSWRGRLRYGFSDPALTGQSYGLLCATGVALSRRCRIEAEFEEAVLEGRIKVRGRIRVFFFVRMAVLIFFDRRLKAVYRKGKDVLGGI